MALQDNLNVINCLHENLRILSDEHGNVPPENQVWWNISNALLAMNDVLQDVQAKL